ncbi:hypothetical protein ACFL5F_07450 [Planctomycetota bacterium]
MVSLKIQKLKQDLRARLGRFVATDSKRHYPHLYRVLEDIRNNDYPAFLCGGAVRNFLLCNNSIPRDLDIILGYVSREQLETLFPDHIKGETSLGGLKLQVKDWSIDMWLIQDTWAFKNGKVTGKGFSDYPKITFLNIDAIAIQLFSKRRQKREIYSQGFFEAIAERTIELNFEENPAPAECIVRALRIANKFKFVIGPRLAGYMISHTNQMEIEELAEIYQRRYTSADVTVEKLHNCFKSIETQMQASNNRPVKVFAEQNSNFFEQPLSLPKRNRDLFAMT